MGADGTEVVPESVANFGKKSLDEGHHLMSEVGAAQGHLLFMQASHLPEAASFTRTYQSRLQEFQAFSTDAVTGLAALGNGGISIAETYRSADMSQAEEMNNVLSAFNPDQNT